jgi:glucosamine--fructose-6-phosphate aminotransferase (isomerizing)
MTLISEIHEQADVLAGLLENQWETVTKIAAAVQKADPDYVFLAARGTSDNAGRYANYVWGSLNGLPVALATPSLFSLYQRPPRLKGALVVGISQSGQSPDIVSVLAEARRQGSPTLAIVNAPGSPLAAAADWVIDIQAGEEKAVAATKTYTAELMAVAMLAAALAASAEMHAELRQVPGWVRSVLGRAEETIGLAERYRFMERCVVLGRGYNYASAFEWSLKLKELSYITAEPYSSADFQHGPIAVVEHGFPVLAIAPSGVVYPGLLELFRQLRREHAAELAIISDRAEALELAQSPMKLPEGMPEWLSPLAAIVSGQLFAYGLTQVKGFSTETPRSIRKVTETH